MNKRKTKKVIMDNFAEYKAQVRADLTVVLPRNLATCLGMSGRPFAKGPKVHEVWHFEESASGLFAEYVDTWLKIKTEASGWPKDCETEEEKQDYIRRFEEKEDIPLEYGAIKKNPGLKATAKLMLNSFWGKYGQRENGCFMSTMTPTNCMGLWVTYP